MRTLFRYLSALLIVLCVAACGGGGGGGGGSAAPTGSATLDWVAPTQNDNGTTLTDLAGFKVHYGTSPGTYTQTITVPNAAAVTYTVTALPAGATYYFVVTAFNAAGVESNPSNEASKAI